MLLRKGIYGKLKLKLKSANGIVRDVECIATPSLNNLNIVEGITLSIIK